LDEGDQLKIAEKLEEDLAGLADKIFSTKTQLIDVIVKDTGYITKHLISKHQVLFKRYRNS